MNASNLFVMGCLTLTSLDIADIPDYIRHREWEEPEEPPATKVLPPSDHVIGKQNGLQVSTTFSRPSKSATVLKIKAKIDRDVAPKTCVPSSIRGLGDGLSSRKRKDGELIITKPSVKSTVRPAWENDNKDCTNEVYRHSSIEDDWLESAASSQRKKPKLKQSKIVFGKQLHSNNNGRSHSPHSFSCVNSIYHNGCTVWLAWHICGGLQVLITLLFVCSRKRGSRASTC